MEREAPTNPEKPRFASPQEAVSRLSLPPDTPSSARHLLGTQNVKKLVDLLIGGPVLEADVLVGTGEMTQAECIQYEGLLPEYEEVERNIVAIVNDFVKELVPKLPAMIKISKEKGSAKGSLFFCFEEVKRFFVALGKGATGYRNFIILKAWNLFWAQFFSAIDKNITHKDQPVVRKFFDEVNEYWRKNEKMDFHGIQFLNEKYHYQTDLARAEYRPVLEDIAPSQPLSPEKKKALHDELALYFEEIKELRQYRKIFLTGFQKGKVKVGLMADDQLIEGEAFSGICCFQIVLEANETLKLPKVINAYGSRGFDFGFRKGVLNVHFDHVSGEIGFWTNPAIPLSEIMNEDQYLLLKHYLYEIVLDYLSSKEPDVEDLFKAPSRKIQAEVRVDIKKALEEQPPTASEISPQDEKTIVAQIPATAPIEAIPERTVEVQIREKEKKLRLLGRIRGIKGPQLLSALMKLMGDPIRISGSHHIFRSPHNHQTFPIPIHAEGVKFPLLRACLEKWEIPLADFCNAI